MLARQRGNVVCRQLGFTAEEKGHAFALRQRQGLAHMIDVLRRVPAGGPGNGAIPQMVCKADGAVSLPRGVFQDGFGGHALVAAAGRKAGMAMEIVEKKRFHAVIHLPMVNFYVCEEFPALEIRFRQITSARLTKRAKKPTIEKLCAAGRRAKDQNWRARRCEREGWPFSRRRSMASI